MDDHVIDCCSLLNLYTGWGGLTELGELPMTWHICRAVLDEVEYTREYNSDRSLTMVPLDMNALTGPGLLQTAQPETDAELEDYVNFASEIDDGEAQALAIAKHRGFVLLTDDRRAIRLANRAEVAVRTISTVSILQRWAQVNSRNEARLHEVIPRIAVLARFGPRTNSPEYDWWMEYCS